MLKLCEAVEWLQLRVLSPGKAMDSLIDCLSICDLIVLAETGLHELHEEFSVKPVTGNFRLDFLFAFDKAFSKKYWPIEYEWEFDVYQGIPVYPLTEDYWNDDFRELPHLSQLILMLWDDAYDTGNDEFSDSQRKAIRKARGNVRGDMLELVCQDVKPPLCYLAQAAETLFYETGNYWLDLSCESIVEPVEWTIENLKSLRDEYVDANEQLNRIYALRGWLCENHKRIHQIINLWDKARNAVPPNKGKPLIELLEPWDDEDVNRVQVLQVQV
jgi:hypothetical protein